MYIRAANSFQLGVRNPVWRGGGGGGGYFAKASLFICRILNILVTNLNLANTQSVTIIQ